MAIFNLVTTAELNAALAQRDTAITALDARVSALENSPPPPPTTVLVPFDVPAPI